MRSVRPICLALLAALAVGCSSPSASPSGQSGSSSAPASFQSPEGTGAPVSSTVAEPTAEPTTAVAMPTQAGCRTHRNARRADRGQVTPTEVAVVIDTSFWQKVDALN